MHSTRSSPHRAARALIRFGKEVLGGLLLALTAAWLPACASAAPDPIAPQPVDAVPYTAEELARLIAPVALYPDDLLAIVLPASTYPLQIVQARRFLDALASDPSLQPDDAWDDSIVALLNYPDVVTLMNDDLDWTVELGQAVLDQQAEVIAAIEGFRLRAFTAGNLRTDERQVVDVEDDAVYIRPANPEVIYVPYYDPAVVTVYHSRPVYHYYPRPYPVYYYPYPAGYRFGSGFFWGVTTYFSLGWHSHHVHVYQYDYRDHPYFGRPHLYYPKHHYYRRPPRVVNHHHYYAGDDRKGHAARDRYDRKPWADRDVRDRGQRRPQRQDADSYWRPADSRHRTVRDDRHDIARRPGREHRAPASNRIDRDERKAPALDHERRSNRLTTQSNDRSKERRFRPQEGTASELPGNLPRTRNDKGGHQTDSRAQRREFGKERPAIERRSITERRQTPERRQALERAGRPETARADVRHRAEPPSPNAHRPTEQARRATGDQPRPERAGRPGNRVQELERQVRRTEREPARGNLVRDPRDPQQRNLARVDQRRQQAAAERPRELRRAAPGELQHRAPGDRGADRDRGDRGAREQRRAESGDGPRRELR